MSNLSPASSEYFPSTSLASMSRRVYPLNLKSQIQLKSPPRKPDKPIVPEFAKEFIKDSARSHSNQKIKRPSLHNRSISYNHSHIYKPQKVSKTEQKSEVPVLSYNQFKGQHCKSNSGSRYFKPQVIQLNQRAKIVLYSAKPIVINPSLYNQRKSSVKPESSRLEHVSEYALPPGMTYGEKILKLKSLVESSIM